MTERKCPIEYGSSDTCDENAVCRDCIYWVNGCKWEELKEQKTPYALAFSERLKDYWR